MPRGDRAGATGGRAVGGRRRAATMEDVARQARVSRQTVSRVLHSSDYVSESTRLRVNRAIRKLGYHPDAVARSLAHRRTYLIAVVLTEFTGSSRARVLMGAEAGARELGYNVFICGSEAGPLDEPLWSPLLDSQKYEGLFILHRGSREDRYALLSAVPQNLPVVTLGYASALPRTRSVVADERRGAAAVVRHLLSRGRGRIAQIAGPAGRYDTEERMRGFEDALREAGQAAEPRLVRHGSWTAESGYEQALALVSSGVRFGGIFVHSDLMAVGAMKALRGRGIAVPGEVAVAGFDDIEIARFVDPPLTTVAQPFDELGRQGMRILVERIEGRPGGGRSVVLPTTVVVRGSSQEPAEGERE